MVCFQPLREQINVAVGGKNNPAGVVAKVKLLPSPITLHPCGIEGVKDFLSLETHSFSSSQLLANSVTSKIILSIRSCCSVVKLQT